ncbi:MAG: DNA gyrase/topoisomerase IV subunit A, partial [Prevotella sp.]|nr:DNA gyrase/topoisomerase IV subunit A [Prevotella sp.]
TLIDSILKAIEKGKIKAKKVDDNTAAEVEIQVHLAPGVSSDKTIDALYAFSDCEINISPNCCVIEDNKPCFLTISDVLRHNVDYTMGLLRKELMIRKNELEEQLFFSSLEKIFIEERIYKDKKFENAENMDAAIEHVDNRLEPYKKNFIREITRDDILRLMEIKMQRILKFNKDKADELIARIKDEIKGINHDLAHMVEVTINWFTFIKNKYGANFPRRTEIRNFDTIEATKVVEANEKLYINRAEGFIGTGLKKDEFVCNCSDIDDIIIFYKDGKYKVIRVADKIFVGKNILHVQVFKKNDTRTIYNVAYRDGRQGYTYMKRFNVTAITRDKEYDLTQGKPGSKILYFTSNPNGEAETIKVTLDSSPTLKTIFLNRDFSQISIRGKSSRGYLLSKKPVHRISLKDRGHSTLGGLKVWYDPDVNRLNYDEHGTFLGEFNDDEKILIVLDNNDFYLTSFDVNNHFENNIKIIEKWNPNKIWTAVLFDADNQGYPYIKRFTMEALKKKQNFVGENPNSKLVILTDQVYPRIKVNFGGLDAYREPMEIDVEEFIMVKGFKAKGKRITTCHIDSIEELEPTKFPEPVEDEDNSEEDTASEEEVSEDKDSSNTTSSQDQTTKQGNPSEQLSLFPDEDS